MCGKVAASVEMMCFEATPTHQWFQWHAAVSTAAQLGGERAVVDNELCGQPRSATAGAEQRTELTFNHSNWWRQGCVCMILKMNVDVTEQTGMCAGCTSHTTASRVAVQHGSSRPAL